MNDPKPEERAFWVKTDARCTNRKIGKLLGGYLFHALAPAEQAAFEKHLEECIACWTDVTNWGNISPAIVNRPAPAEIDRTKKSRSFKAGT